MIKATSIENSPMRECSSLLQVGTDAFFDGFAKAVPVLGSRFEYELYLSRFLPDQSRGRRLLMLAVATIGISTSLPPGSEAVTTMNARLREASSEDHQDNGADLSWNVAESLATSQMELLLAYRAYGCNQITQASSHLKQACFIALQFGLNKFDRPDFDLSKLLDGPAWTDGEISASGNGSRPTLLSEMCRRTWWELFLFDTMLHASTTGQVARVLDSEALVASVHAPRDVGRPAGSRHHNAVYDIRIRTAALVEQCVKPPEGPHRLDTDRLQALDTMLSNLIVTAQRLWASASTALRVNQMETTVERLERASACSGDGETRWAREVEVELLFAALLMLHAGRIHLHRQAWFTDLTLDFSSCTFRPQSSLWDHDEPPSMPASATEETRYAMLRYSTSRIIASSDAMMRHIRADQARSPLPRAVNSTPDSLNMGRLPVHWPFFGCCNTVAAFGYVVAIAAGDGGGDGKPELRVLCDDTSMTGISPAFVLSSCNDNGLDISDFARTAGQSRANTERGGARPAESRGSNGDEALQPCQIPQDAASSGVWKARLALSNIRFAEATLAEYSEMWPVCAPLREEVSLCRAAVDFCGPTGFRAP